MRRTARKRRQRRPDGQRQRVMLRSGGLCVACCAKYGLYAENLSCRRAVQLYKERLVSRAVHCHHVLPVEKWPEWELEEDNQVGVCAGCHDEHERAHRRIPFAALPPCSVMLARAAGAAAWAYVKQVYP